VSPITKQQLQFIRSLKDRKVRDENNCFVVEGLKLVQELIEQHAGLIESVFCSDPELLSNDSVPVSYIKPSDLERISSQKTPNKAIAIVKKPVVEIKNDNPLVLVLDGIQDPGNLGTIIRTANWFGIDHVICSKDTVDCFNSKVVQSTMGSLFRVKIEYTDLANWLEKTDRIKYAAALSGETNSIYQMKTNAVLVIGNEGNGISSSVLSFCNATVTIPQFGNTESLNAAVATGILLAEFTKQHY
jgi:TrmH family RNA methyltransferase